MIDIAILRERPADLATSLARRGVTINLEALAALDKERRSSRAEAEVVRSKQKEIGKSIPRLDGADKQVAIAEAGDLAGRYKKLLTAADDLDEEFNAQWMTLPNMTDPSAAEGLEEEDAVEIKRVGEPPEFDFEAVDHLDLGISLGIIDVERAVKMSGSRFALKKGKLALLEMALMRWAVENISTHGFTPVIPPVLVREHALYGTGFFPGDREQV